jgi:pyruvate/2-oxoglutarate dehydrogenase complex dihydrolipoamide dehydrogenase (E3) component
MLHDFHVDYLQAEATVESATVLSVASDSLPSVVQVRTDALLLATGSKPNRPKEIPFDDKRVFDSDTVNFLSFLPATVTILGAGIVSIEYAKIFHKLGAKVTMLVRGSATDAMTRVGIDRDIVDFLLDVLRKDGVAIYENTSISNFEVPTDSTLPLRLQLKTSAEGVPGTLESDIFLAATGRRANFGGIDVEKLGIQIAKGGYIEADDDFRTSAPGILAAGDVVGPPSLASTGVYQAQHAINAWSHGTEHKGKVSYPVGMWTTPECSYYGMTKEAAEKAGLDVEEGVAPFSSCLRGRVFAPEGLLKLVFEKESGVIVGVHGVGTDVCEILHYGMDLVERRVTIFEVMTTLYVAVTFHELFKEAAINGNSKLRFGMQWHLVFDEICAAETKLGRSIGDEDLTNAFLGVDASGKGTVDKDGLAAIFQKLGLEMRSHTIKDLCFLADESHTGCVTLDQLVEIFQHSTPVDHVAVFEEIPLLLGHTREEDEKAAFEARLNMPKMVGDAPIVGGDVK